MSNNPESLATNGVRQNGRRAFQVRFTGEEIYAPLKTLEERAVAESNYLEVRRAVYFAETIREQVKEQGF